MKKFYLMILVAFAALVSCTKDYEPLKPETDAQETVAEEAEIVFNFTFDGDYSYEGGSKAVKQGWAAGDIVFVFVDNITGGYLRLTNQNGTTTGWKTEQFGSIASELPEGQITVRAIYVPFAGTDMAPTYGDGKWTIETGDVYFTSASANADVKSEGGKKYLTAKISLQRYPGYVQIYIDKDARFPENAQYHCNMLDRYDKVTLTDGTFAPVQAEDNVHFNVRPLFAENPDGIVFYGILRTDDGKPSKTVFRVDGGFNEQGIPTTSPIVFTYECKQLTTAKAYKLEYQNTSLKMGRWARTLWGEYKVTDKAGVSHIVRFAPGNLRVNQKGNPAWTFATRQREIVGEGNKDIYDGYAHNNKWYDLFQWGATGVCSHDVGNFGYLDASFVPSLTGVQNAEGIVVNYINYAQHIPNVQYIGLTPGGHGGDDVTGYRKDLVDAAGTSHSGDFIFKDCAFHYTTGTSLVDPHKTGSPTIPTDGDDWGSNNIEYNNANVFRTLTGGEWLSIKRADGVTAIVTKAPVTVNGMPGWAIALTGTLADSYTDETWAAAELNQGAVFFPQAGVRNAVGWPLDNTLGRYPYAVVTLCGGSYNAEGCRYHTASIVGINGEGTKKYSGVAENRNGGAFDGKHVVVNGCYPYEARPVRLSMDVNPDEIGK